MAENLGVIDVQRKSGDESFTSSGKKLGFNLLEFWEWNGSDLISNAMRGRLAEFIVAKALGLAKGVRHEWDAYDLEYRKTIIEIKTSAYIQSWKQSHLSKIVFGMQPTRAWNYETNEFGDEIKRHSDVYVFCVLSHKDQSTINPLDLDQWEFYILPTRTLDEKVPNQKTISLSSLQNLNPDKVNFNQLKNTIDRVIEPDKT